MESVTEPENGLRFAPGGDHIIQLFDTAESLGLAVSAFMRQGWTAGDHLLVIAKPRHWRVVVRELRKHGVSVSDATAQGRLTVVKVHDVLTAIMRGAAADRDLFRSTIGDILDRLPIPLRVYGEIVEVLAEEGNYGAACQLEEWWNELQRQRSFSLLCGYSAAHFADPAANSALRAICGAHTRVHCHSSDVLGSWLLDQGGAGIVNA